MKKIIKNLNIKVLLTILSLIAFQSIVFFITKFFIQEPYILNTTLDNLLPYIPQFIWIYVFWYIMLAIVPYYIAHKNIDSFYKYTITFVITTLMAGLIFVIFPNGVIRANITDTSISSKIVKIIYNLDNPAINCLPSIHCLYSFLFIFAIFDTKKILLYGLK